jgi:hypothetical protein
VHANGRAESEKAFKTIFEADSQRLNCRKKQEKTSDTACAPFNVGKSLPNGVFPAQWCVAKTPISNPMS